MASSVSCHCIDILSLLAGMRPENVTIQPANQPAMDDEDVDGASSAGSGNIVLDVVYYDYSAYTSLVKRLTLGQFV